MSATSNPGGRRVPDAEGRRRQPRGAARREAILDTAVELFAAQGFRATGIIGLAKRVGLTHSGLLYYFGTKQNLLLEVVRRRDAYQQQLQTDLQVRRGIAALELLNEAARESIDAPVFTRLFAVLIGESLQPEDPLNLYFRVRYGLVRGYFAEAVRTGQADGEVRADADPDAVGAEVLAVLVGMQTQWLLDPDSVDLRARIADYAERLIASLHA